MDASSTSPSRPFIAHSPSRPFIAHPLSRPFIAHSPSRPFIAHSQSHRRFFLCSDIPITGSSVLEVGEGAIIVIPRVIVVADMSGNSPKNPSEISHVWKYFLSLIAAYFVLALEDVINRILPSRFTTWNSLPASTTVYHSNTISVYHLRVRLSTQNSNSEITHTWLLITHTWLLIRIGISPYKPTERDFGKNEHI